MTSLTYNDKQFIQQSHAYQREVSFASNCQVTQRDSTVRVIDWNARTNELLSIFNDDSLPSVSGKFGTSLF